MKMFRTFSRHRKSRLTSEIFILEHWKLFSWKIHVFLLKVLNCNTFILIFFSFFSYTNFDQTRKFSSFLFTFLYRCYFFHCSWGRLERFSEKSSKLLPHIIFTFLGTKPGPRTLTHKPSLMLFFFVKTFLNSDEQVFIFVYSIFRYFHFVF